MFKIIVYHKLSISKPNDILIFQVMIVFIAFFTLQYFVFLFLWMSLIIDALPMCLVSLMNNLVIDVSVFPGLRDVVVKKPCEVLTLKELTGWFNIPKSKKCHHNPVNATCCIELLKELNAWLKTTVYWTSNCSRKVVLFQILGRKGRFYALSI